MQILNKKVHRNGGSLGITFPRGIEEFKNVKNVRIIILDGIMILLPEGCSSKLEQEIIQKLCEKNQLLNLTSETREMLEELERDTQENESVIIKSAITEYYYKKKANQKLK